MSEPSAPADALELLADDTRLAILRALADRREAAPDDPTLSFTELRERAGVADSGRFNYHLRELCGQFVRERPEGYELGYRGAAVVDAATGAVRTDDVDPDADGEDDVCPVCGEQNCERRIHVHLRP